jgi:hypothetical protein
MKCEKCNIRLKITHTYQAGDLAKTSTARCPKCGRRYTALTILVSDVSGASAWASRMRKACKDFSNRVMDLLKNRS